MEILPLDFVFICANILAARTRNDVKCGSKYMNLKTTPISVRILYFEKHVDGYLVFLQTGHYTHAFPKLMKRRLSNNAIRARELQQ